MNDFLDKFIAFLFVSIIALAIYCYYSGSEGISTWNISRALDNHFKGIVIDE